jgi:hypothetical protein
MKRSLRHCSLRYRVPIIGLWQFAYLQLAMIAKYGADWDNVDNWKEVTDGPDW